MNKEKIWSVIEDDGWEINVWNFREEWEARAFIYSHFEEMANLWNIDKIDDDLIEDLDIDEEANLIYLHLDWYYLWLSSSYLFNKNPNNNDWTKEFRGDTERSRQEDRDTTWNWWET